MSNKNPQLVPCWAAVLMGLAIVMVFWAGGFSV